MLMIKCGVISGGEILHVRLPVSPNKLNKGIIYPSVKVAKDVNISIWKTVHEISHICKEEYIKE